jgi:hypothetical protein
LINLEEKKDLNEVDKYRIQNLDSYKKLQESVYQSNRDGIKKRLRMKRRHLRTLRKNMENSLKSSKSWPSKLSKLKRS